MRVAIIGAGFSGMTAAYLLEKKGIDVTVYEKRNRIGGHCMTLVNKGFYFEVGTVFSFCEHIKELLIELKVDYTERFTYRNFVDSSFQKVEHVSRNEVSQLIEEMETLENLLEKYALYLNDLNYGYVPEELNVPLVQFLETNNLPMISQIIAPHLSSFGFGSVEETQAYYAFKIFSCKTINDFIRNKKLLFLNRGTSELIGKLSQNIADIRYGIEVINIEPSDSKIKVQSIYGSDFFDKVLITTKLPQNVIKHDLLNHLMNKIDTHPYVTCTYEVADKNIVTTYYKSNLGQKEKIQFFHTFKHKKRTILVAYAYGLIGKELVNNITSDIEKTGIDIKHLITAKQWYIFPHLKAPNLERDFYRLIHENQASDAIYLIGSLISKPSISSLYASIKKSVNEIFD